VTPAARRWLRRGLALAALAAAALLGTRLLVDALDLARQRAFLERELSSALGLAVTIGGPLRIELLPQPGFAAADVTVANLPGRPSPHLAEIGQLQLRFASWRLLLGELDVDELVLRRAEIRIETDTEGRLGLAPDVEALTEASEPGPLTLSMRRLAGEDVRVFRAGAAGSDRWSLKLDSFSVEERAKDGPLDARAVGQMDGGAFDVEGQLGPLRELLRPSEPYPVALGGTILGASLDAEGTVLRPLSLAGLDLGFSLAIPDAAELLGTARPPAFELGPLTARGRLVEREGRLGAEDLTVQSSGPGEARLELSGSIRDLVALEGVRLDLHLKLLDPRLLTPWVALPLPASGSLEADASISDADGSLGVEGRLHAQAYEGGLDLDVRGGDTDIRHSKDLRLGAKLRSTSLPVLGRALGLDVELPDLGPVVVQAVIRDRAGTLGLDEIRAELGRRTGTWAHVTGEVRDALHFEGIQLEGEFAVADLGDLRPWVAAAPKDLGPLRATAQLSDRDGTLGVERFRLSGGRPGVFHVSASGAFDDLRAIDEITLQGEGQAHDLGVLGKLFGADLPALGPLTFSGQITGSHARIASKGLARIGETNFDGRWSASFAPEARPRIEAEIRSAHVRLADLGVEPRFDPLARGRAIGERLRAEPWWSGMEPLPFDQLRRIDAAIDVRAERVTGREALDLRGVDLTLRLDDGDLSIRPSLRTADGGSLAAQLRADTRTPVPRLTARANVRGLDLEKWRSQLEHDTERVGIADLSLDLASSGSTRDALRTDLSGHVALLVKGGTIASATARRFVFDLTRMVLPAFQLRRIPQLACFRADLSLDRGLAAVDSLILRGGDITVTGQGSIDLRRERYDLTLVPEPRDPGLLSVAASVRMTGPLDDPSFTPIARTLATSAARSVLSTVRRVPEGLIPPMLWKGPAEGGDACAAPLVPVALSGPGG
jgi:AsmA-like C-terminal region/AsmA family